MKYARHISMKQTSVTEPIPGRSDQVVNHDGGYVFEISAFDRLRRFLILGCEGGSYYQGERELTRENADCLFECLKEDAGQAVELIAETSEQGKAYKQEPALFALALAASQGCGTNVVSQEDEKVHQLVWQAFPRVVRTGSHLMSFLAYVKAQRGLGGSGLKRAVQRWLNAKRDDKLVYQAFKYNQRSKFSWADFLELTRPKPGSESKSEIFRYLTRTAKWAERKREDKEVPTSLAPYIAARDVKAPADAVLADVVSGKVSWEMVASEKRDKKFWEAILQKLPMTALVRNLANLTRYDVLTNGDFERLSWLRTRLTDTEAIQKARLHPLQFLAALLRYQTGRGQEGRRGKAHTWSPITQVNDILEEGIDKAFVTVPETDTATLVGVDISGSMQGSWSAPVMGIPGFSAAMAAGLMAQQFIRRAPNSTVFGYDQQVYKLGLSPKDSYSTTVRKVSLGGGLTNTSLPILAAHQLHAQNKRVKYETIVIITDNEINRGTVHPVQALEAYRRLVGLPVRLVIMAVTATNFSVADPKDPHQLDVPGLDNTTPKVVHDFARGEI